VTASMTRDEYHAARRARWQFKQTVRYFGLNERQQREESRYYPSLPSPPRSEVGQLLLDQAARRKNVLHSVGYRQRQAARDALPPIPSRIPQIAGWDRSEGVIA
jgi:hypothetical protein